MNDGLLERYLPEAHGTLLSFLLAPSNVELLQNQTRRGVSRAIRTPCEKRSVRSEPGGDLGAGDGGALRRLWEVSDHFHWFEAAVGVVEAVAGNYKAAMVTEKLHSINEVLEKWANIAVRDYGAAAVHLFGSLVYKGGDQFMASSDVDLVLVLSLIHI